MAFSAALPVVQNINLQTTYSLSQAIAAPITFTMIPKAADGTIFDTTPLTTASINFSNKGYSGVNLLTSAGTTTPGTHDATKLVQTVTPARITAAALALGSFNLPYVNTIYDGTTTVIVAQGILSVNLVP